MKSFLRKIVTPLYQYTIQDQPTAVKEYAQKHRSDMIGRSLNFKVYPAVGGNVVQVDRYENLNTIGVSANDRLSLYIITDQEDFGEEIGKILTIEGLRR